MNLENFISFCRATRRLGGNIILKQFERQDARHKWVSSFTALSFTFLSAFPGLPVETALSVPTTVATQVEATQVVIPTETPSDELCQFKRDLREIKKAHETTTQDQEVLCQQKSQPDTEVIDPSIKENLEKQLIIEEVTEGSPIHAMAGSIAHFDKSIAGLLVGIAKKESSWGEHSPSKGGEDCYNYWGYKGAGGRGTAMGYACFASREEAVETVGARLEKLVEKRASSDPSRLVTSWKCGNSCATHSKESVSKWVSDVHKYYSQIALQK